MENVLTKDREEQKDELYPHDHATYCPNCGALVPLRDGACVMCRCGCRLGSCEE